jgi:hypothetical protein
MVARIAALRHRRDRDHQSRDRRVGPERLLSWSGWRSPWAAQRELPRRCCCADLAALQHDRRDHRVLFGVVSAIFRHRLAEGVAGRRHGPARRSAGRSRTRASLSIPLGFIGCFLGTMLSREHKAERTFDELFVRSETGLGAERALTN